MTSGTVTVASRDGETDSRSVSPSDDSYMIEGGDKLLVDVDALDIDTDGTDNED